MSDHSPAAVVSTYFDALARGDMPVVMSQFSDQVVWHQPGHNRFSGDHTGVAGVDSLLRAMMEISEGTFRLSVTGGAMVNGDLVAVPVHFAGTRSGAAMSMSGVDLLTVRAGKIVEVHLFSEDGPAEDHFWGPA